jgi:NADPH:quinone reductase-like Zn-dependent oxidoreductase
MAEASQDFIVKRSDWGDCKFVPAAPDELDAGQVLLRVDRFAMTANNITYAAVGDMVGYWKFFPAEDGWGRIPVMGFADVVKSNHPEAPEGDRVFGWLPMSNHLTVQADAVTAANFLDVVEHRAATAPVYRTYTRASNDPFYSADHEDQYALLWGLFMTSFLLDDMLADNELFGAKTFVMSSASSKTAIALAHLLSEQGRGEVVGLTSERNVEFVKGLGYYDQTLRYDEIGSVSGDAPAVFVDFAGNSEVVSAVHHHFGDNLKFSSTVGMTHWQAPRQVSEMPGPRPEMFFAPTQMVKSGAEGMSRAIAAWRGFRDSSDAWLTVKRGYGLEAVESVYRETLEGRAKPSEGHVLSLWGRND